MAISSSDNIYAYVHRKYNSNIEWLSCRPYAQTCCTYCSVQLDSNFQCSIVLTSTDARSLIVNSKMCLPVRAPSPSITLPHHTFWLQYCSCRARARVCVCMTNALILCLSSDLRQWYIICSPLCSVCEKCKPRDQQEGRTRCPTRIFRYVRHGMYITRVYCSRYATKSLIMFVLFFFLLRVHINY